MKKKLFFCLTSFLLFFSTPVLTDDKVEFFTLDQEKYLAQHPHVYAYFSQLYTGNQKTPAELEQQYNLSPEITHKYLQALAKIKLIEMPKNGSDTPVHFLVNGVSGFSAYSPLSIKLTESMFKQHFDKSIQAVEQGIKDMQIRKKLHISMAGFWLTQDEYEQYKKDIYLLQDKYSKLSKQNLKSKRMNVFRISTLDNAIQDWEPEVFTEIKKDF